MQKFYTGWDSGNGLQWKVDSTIEAVWESTNSILTAWKLGTRKDTSHCVMTSIPPQQIEIIRQSLGMHQTSSRWRERCFGLKNCFQAMEFEVRTCKSFFCKIYLAIVDL